MKIWAMPSLTQFTASLWIKTNDTGKSLGSIFTYGIPDQYSGIGIMYGSLGFPQINVDGHNIA